MDALLYADGLKTDWRVDVVPARLDEADDQLGVIWSGMLEGLGHPKLEWSPSGYLPPIDLAAWSSRWDPGELLRAR